MIWCMVTGSLSALPPSSVFKKRSFEFKAIFVICYFADRVLSNAGAKHALMQDLNASLLCILLCQLINNNYFCFLSQSYHLTDIILR